MAAETAKTPRKLPLVWWVVFVLVGWLVAANFKDVVWYNIFPKRFAVVSEGEIYRSGKLTTAALTRVVREHEIKTIVDLGAWEEGSRADLREQKTAESLGVDRVRLPGLSGDATGSLDSYAQALHLITDPDNHPVLLHCGAGTERTGCVVALFRMHEEGWTLDEAYDEATAAGHRPSSSSLLRQRLEEDADEIIETFEGLESDG
jgi:protein tyrosine/serine phosphatase